MFPPRLRLRAGSTTVSEQSHSPTCFPPRSRRRLRIAPMIHGAWACMARLSFEVVQQSSTYVVQLYHCFCSTTSPHIDRDSNVHVTMVLCVPNICMYDLVYCPEKLREAATVGRREARVLRSKYRRRSIVKLAAEEILCDSVGQVFLSSHVTLHEQYA